ncbi:MAG: acyltransferase [Oscillospiraceae bacterium]|nr:acyltransferase [Oscillospiraceae bacterium]
MTFKRLWQTFRLYTIRGSAARTEYIRKKKVYGAIGDNCSIEKRKVPLYANLIRLGNNVHIASNVSFLTHDITCTVLNAVPSVKERGGVQERIGCIEIGDNVFVGSGTHILYDTKIGSNVIIGTCSVVTHDIPDNSVVAGVPARVIGSFDDFAEKMLSQEKYPEELKPRKQTVSPELAKFMWEKFDREHN